jgi:HD-GYP domain-containing protein (c-di-GMP phosphodiesterase class II)
MNKTALDIDAAGRSIIKQLAIVLKQGQFHDAGNAVVISSIEEFLNIINPVIESEGVQKIELVGDIFYLNNTLIKYPLASSLNFDYLIKEFKKRDLGSLTFTSQLSKANIKAFLNIFTNAAHSHTPFEDIKSSLKEIQNIDGDKLKFLKEEDDTDKRKFVIRTYLNAVSFTKGIMAKLGSGERASVKKAKRVVGTIIDAILAEEQFLFGISAIKDFDDYTFHHSVNVSVLSIAMGQRLGFKRKALVDLGFAALFHDIGKTDIPKEIVNKTDPFTEEEWKEMKRHPYLGALSILKLKELDETLMRNALVSIEHHMNYDLSGYPELKGASELELFSKIVAIADHYDAMTSSRVYSRIPHSPDEALRVMKKKSGIYIDPHLFKLFVNMVGVFPIGSLVLLDSGEMGLVYKNNPNFFDRPQVMIIVNRSGEKTDGFIIDLMEEYSSGKFVHNIVKTIDPNKYRINLAEFLL